MRQPHHFFWDNLVLRSPSDPWAVYELSGHNYPGLSAKRKIEVAERLEALVYTLEADFQLLRVSRAFDADAYVHGALGTLDPRHGHRERFESHLAEHRAAFEEREALRTEVYLAVRLGRATGAGVLGGLLGAPAELWGALASRLGYAEAPGLTRGRLAALRLAEEKVYDLLLGYLDCERVGSLRLAGLIRRAYTRGLGEPDLDESFAPQALSFLDTGGEECFRPYAYDLMRLHESRVEIGRRSLMIDSERGRAHQALLVLGALPEEALLPSAAAELMFTPLEVGFPVDAILSVEYISNPEAQRLAARRKVDADQIAREEAEGDHGPSVAGVERTHQARELEGVLAGGDRPPLLRSVPLLALGAPSAERLEERVQRLRESYGRVQLHRPAGEQHRLFLASLPAARFPLPEYKEHLLPDQVGAMVPHAVSAVGSAAGPYIGYTLGGSRAPVCFDLAEASQENLPPTCLLAGRPGSGKTILLELMAWQAFLQGSLVVDIDPQGDHRLHELPGVAEHSKTIEIRPDGRHRGQLDPMAIGTDENREDLTYSFLVSILPPPVRPEWQTQLRLAVAEASAAGARSCADVLERMTGSGDEDALAAARAVEIHGSSGLAGLGLGEAGSSPPEIGDAQLIALRIHSLNLPREGTSGADLTEEERISKTVLRLLATYALRLCAADRTRHAMLPMDEAWVFTEDSQGRAMLDHMGRLGRRRNVTPVLATQLLGDAAALRGLFGAFVGFGVADEIEAKAFLEMLRMDPEDEAALQRQLSYAEGRCRMRDFKGRVAPLQVDPPGWLLEELDTMPPERAAARRLLAPEQSEATGASAP